MKNVVVQHQDYAEVKVFFKDKEMWCLVDPEDLKIMNEHEVRWYAWYSKDNDSYYVCRWFYDENKKLKVTYLHREIMGSPKGLLVDHINHNTLDNRKVNLRSVTAKVNQRNRKGAQSNSSSGVRGVSFEKFTGKWKAQINYNGKNVNLGRYNTIEEAKKVVEAKRKELEESC